MSEKLKDLIDKAEEDEHSRAVMEKTIEKLKTEVKSLNAKLESQKEPFRPLRPRLEEEREDSEEIKKLKEIVSSLKEDLNQKDQEKEKLNEKVRVLTKKMDEMKEKESDSIKEEILLKTQNSLNNLIEDYSRLEKSNKLLKEEIAKLQQETFDKSSEKSEMTQGEGLKQEIDKLKNQLSSLEEKNKSLIHNIQLLESKSSSSEELDILIEKLKQNNSQLEIENRGLNEKLEELKRDKLRILKYEKQISELSMKINQLEEANKELKKRDSILLAKTITAMEPQIVKKSAKVRTPEIKPLPSSIIELSSIIKEEKPKEPTKLVEEEKKPILDSEPIKEVLKQASIPRAEESKESIESAVVKVEEEATRKWQCPHCGNKNKAYIRELDDKTRLIYSYPKIYAKKYICGQCGKEWK
jgi:DNA-directed RNA polymerase subunit RPC12/RpoP